MERFVKAVAFDFGHTLVNEQLVEGPLILMPGVHQTLPRISLPMAIWANTRAMGEAVLRKELEFVELQLFISCIVTSIDAGFRKPAPEFFRFALDRWEFRKEEVLFVGNQLNTDVLGAEGYGIRTAWLSAPEFRSADETMTPDEVKPSFVLARFEQLISLLDLIAIKRHA